MKKIWMAGLACLIVLGITIPVIASNIGKAEIETEQEASTQSTETPQAEVQTEVKTQPVCGSYVDANPDGICDHCAAGTQNPTCGYYVDANGDGICDHCVAGSGQNSGNQRGGGHHRQSHHGGGHHGRR